MAITDLLGLAFGGSRTANQTSLTVATTAAVAAGELVVVAVSVDNFGSFADGTNPSVVSVTFGGSVSLTPADTCGPTLASDQTSPALSVWWGIIPSAMASGQNIVATFINAGTSDHSVLNARHFRLTGSGITVENSVRQFVGATPDPPSLDVTTANVEKLRYRAVSGRPLGSVGAGYSTTSGGWSGGTAYSANAGSSTPDWELTAYAESIVFTGTSKASDPSPISPPAIAINANIYVVFNELPITGTLAATDGGDSASFPGGVVTLGTIEAYEGAVWLRADSTLYTADDDVTRVNSATILRDVASFAGTVVTGVSGTLAATEATTDTAVFSGTARMNAALAATESADTASFAGTVRWNAVLAATEVADTAAFVGTARWNAALAATESADTAAFAGTAAFLPLTGTLAATETADVAAFTGFGQAFGALAALENRDTAAFTGGPVIAGVLAAIEVGDDAADFHGVITNAGTLDAVEVGNDTAAFSGFSYVAVTLAATEAPDVALFEGYRSMSNEKVGTLNAHESGGVGGAVEPTADSTVVTADQTIFTSDLDRKGGDTAHFVGGTVIGAVLDATEGESGFAEPTADSTLYTADQTIFTVDRDNHPELANFGGSVHVAAVLAAIEQGKDTASFVASIPAVGTLIATEGKDVAVFLGDVGAIKAVLAAVEGSDTAYFSVPRWDEVGAGAGLENEVLRTVWLAGHGGRVTWLENEVEDISRLQNLSPEVISLTNEVQRITELRP